MEETTRAVEERPRSGGVEGMIREVRRKARRKFSAEDKIRIVLEGFRRELPVSDFASVMGSPQLFITRG